MHTWGQTVYMRPDGFFIRSLIDHKLGVAVIRASLSWKRIGTIVESPPCTHMATKPSPLKKETWTHAKMDIIDFKAIFEPTSATEARTIIEACSEPSCASPRISR